MNLATTLEIYADGIAPKTKHHAVISHDMAKKGGMTRDMSKPKEGSAHHGGGHVAKVKHPFMRKSGVGHTGGKKSGTMFKHAMPHKSVGTSHGLKHHAIGADASPSDLASHHTWLEPSSTDVTIKAWKKQRQKEKELGHSLDPFDSVWEMEE